MKKRIGIQVKAGLLTLLAVGIILLGGIKSVQVFGTYADTVADCQIHTEMLEPLQAAGARLLLWGGVTVAGLAMLIVILLYFSGRSRRELQALQKKNATMEQLNRQARELAHHQRLETIGTLTSSISHEFNNLLTPIMGYSMMALEKLPPEEEELYDNLLEIYNASRKAKTIISRLSDLSRKNTDNTFRDLSPDEIIKKTMDVAAPAKPEHVEIHLSLDCGEQRIRANEIQMSQMMLNLVLNGFQAMGDDPGTLTIQTWFDEEMVHIMVADTGCGMDEDTKARMFDPFFTTKESGRGTGLGLAIVQQVMEDHKGKLQVESSPGNGTAITVSLPRNVRV